MIVIAGGTGRLGSILARSLAGRGLPVRVLARHPDRGNDLRSAGVEVVKGDVIDAASVRAALAGATSVVSAVHGLSGAGRGHLQAIDVKGNASLVNAAEAEGAAVVMLSVVGASAEHPMALFRAKFAAEEHLRASRCPWTIVRATAYVELWAELVAKGLIFGRGENPINFVSVTDVAHVVEHALTDPTLGGRVLEVAGPENLTLNQLASLLHAVGRLNRPVRHLPRGLLRAMAPLDPRAAASVAMDTAELTATTTWRPEGLPVTALRSALEGTWPARAVAAPTSAGPAAGG